MPRAHRYFLPGHVWHITHRCHQKAFLLHKRDDRLRWLFWLAEARERFGLCVLDYIVTCNHVHMLVRDRGLNEIPRSIALVAGRTGWEFNRRNERVGAFWQDRYHATAIDSETHLFRCIRYIDMNMVRAGVVSHPVEWRESGYVEIQEGLVADRPIVDIPALLELTRCMNNDLLRKALSANVSGVSAKQGMQRHPAWTEALAVGREEYLESFKSELGHGARNRSVEMSSPGFSMLQDGDLGTYLEG